jgi:hypothetical protein
MSRQNNAEKSLRIDQKIDRTMQHDIDNLGRRLIEVEWDVGITAYVFPSEIEILERENHVN